MRSINTFFDNLFNSILVSSFSHPLLAVAADSFLPNEAPSDWARCSWLMLIYSTKVMISGRSVHRSGSGKTVRTQNTW